MQEAIEVIVPLLRGETVTFETDWFALRNACLQLPPFSDPHLEVAISLSRTPASAQLAGKWGLGILAISGTSDAALQGLRDNWSVAEQTAALHGQNADRGRLRICSFMHIAETREKALEDVKFGLDAWCRYLAEAGGLALIPPDVTDPADFLIESGLATIGAPEDAIRHIERIHQVGEFGTLLIFGHDWAGWEQTKRSYELIARYVMPHFNNGFAARQAAYDFNLKNRESQLAELEKGRPAGNSQQHPRRSVLGFAHKIDRAIRRLDPRFRSN